MSLSYLSEEFRGFDRGSYRFTKEQRDSWRLIVDVEVLSTIREPYVNYKYPLPQGFYGYCQLFYGTSHSRDIAIKYPRQRIIDSINWNTLVSQLDRRRYLWLNAMFLNLADATLEIEGVFPEVPQAYEIFSLPETILKFQSEFSSAFRFVISWLPLSLLAEYSEAQDSDDTDPSDGKDEYPSPVVRDISSPLPDGFTPSESNPDNDARDYPEGGTIPDGYVGRTYLNVGWNGWNGYPLITNYEYTFPGRVKFPLVYLLGPVAGQSGGYTIYSGFDIRDVEGTLILEERRFGALDNPYTIEAKYELVPGD